jgi:hypothetical protein
LLPVYIPKGRETTTPMFITTLFTIAKGGNNPPPEKQINKLWFL